MRFKNAHRWSRRLLLGLAALPLFQTVSGCDQIVSAAASQFVTSTFSLVVSSAESSLLQHFPDMDVLQILLGANRQPFFQG